MSEEAPWNVGDPCRAVFPDDGLEYEATIESLEASEDGTPFANIVFLFYGNKQATFLTDLLASHGPEVRALLEPAVVAEAVVAPAAVWNVGDLCRAVYAVDGQVYDCTIDSLTTDEDGNQVAEVTYVGYGNKETVYSKDLLPPVEATAADEAVAVAAEDAAQDVVEQSAPQESVEDPVPVLAAPQAEIVAAGVPEVEVSRVENPALFVTSTPIDQPSSPRWKTGDSCRAVNPLDDIEYEGIIQDIIDTDDGLCVTVKKLGSDEEVFTAWLDSIVPSRGASPTSSSANSPDQTVPQEHPSEEVSGNQKPWKTGGQCRTFYPEDGLEYEATIEDISTSDDGNVFATVEFVGYETRQTVWLVDLVESHGKAARDQQLAAIQAAAGPIAEAQELAALEKAEAEARALDAKAIKEQKKAAAAAEAKAIKEQKEAAAAAEAKAIKEQKEAAAAAEAKAIKEQKEVEARAAEAKKKEAEAKVLQEQKEAAARAAEAIQAAKIAEDKKARELKEAQAKAAQEAKITEDKKAREMKVAAARAAEAKIAEDKKAREQKEAEAKAAQEASVAEVEAQAANAARDQQERAAKALSILPQQVTAAPITTGKASPTSDSENDGSPRIVPARLVSEFPTTLSRRIEFLHNASIIGCNGDGPCTALERRNFFDRFSAGDFCSFQSQPGSNIFIEALIVEVWYKDGGHTLCRVKIFGSNEETYLKMSQLTISHGSRARAEQVDLIAAGAGAMVPARVAASASRNKSMLEQADKLAVCEAKLDECREKFVKSVEHNSSLLKKVEDQIMQIDCLRSGNQELRLQAERSETKIQNIQENYNVARENILVYQSRAAMVDQMTKDSKDLIDKVESMKRENEVLKKELNLRRLAQENLENEIKGLKTRLNQTNINNNNRFQ